MKKYAALIKYNELGQAKMVRTNVAAKNMADAVRQVTPLKALCWMTYEVEGRTTVTMCASRIITIQVSELAGE